MAEYGRCGECKSRGLCAADCSTAPWNWDDNLKWPTGENRRFIFLLRQRRWCGNPVPREDIRFIEYPHRVPGMWMFT